MDHSAPRNGARTSQPRPQTMSVSKNYPQAASQPTQAVPDQARSPVNRLLKWVFLAVAVVVLTVLLWFGWKQFAGTSTVIDRDKYQAVFLTNGQVYFGKLQNSHGDYLVLQKIFYLQASNTVPNPSESENPQETEGGQAENDVQLIKLGTEVHAPTDEMVISREQVLFFENLKNDGSVSQSIKQYYETNQE